MKLNLGIVLAFLLISGSVRPATLQELEQRQDRLEQKVNELLEVGKTNAERINRFLQDLDAMKKEAAQNDGAEA